MFFDDRLATVLRQRATGETGLRTQYRQLLDLLGKDRVQPASRQARSLVAAAWLRLDALAEAIPAGERAAIIREPGWRFRSTDLAAHLAEQEPDVVIAALGRAELSSDEWTQLIPRLPVRARGFLRLRRDLPLDVEALLTQLGVHDRGLPYPEASADAAPEPAAGPWPSADTALDRAAPLRFPDHPAAPPPHLTTPQAPLDREASGRSEISALVERIAQFRRERSEQPVDSDLAPRLPLGEQPERPEQPVVSFGFATDAGGRIEWASPEVAPMVTGTRLLTPRPLGSSAAPDNAIELAFARRQPIVALPFSLSGAPAIAGEWTLDAQPSFSLEGHFTGYVGRLRRPSGTTDRPDGPAAREADRIRQLLHELRTPVTAVQGYAEVIQQQLFGPASNEYRALAAGIAADAARILAGFDELDRLARLETGVLGIEPGEADLAMLVRRIVEQLTPVLAAREAAVTLRLARNVSLLTGCDSDDAEALVWRVLASLAAACSPQEQLTGRLAPVIVQGRPMARLECNLPAELAREDNLFAATARNHHSAINPGLFGAGFAFRLARAEARAAGGDLRREGADVVLTLPLLTMPAAQSGAQPGARAGEAG